MPGGMSGYELAGEVRRRRPGIAVLMTSEFPGIFCRMPVMISTSFANRSRRQNWRRLY
jgi:hypothetical protein